MDIWGTAAPIDVKNCLFVEMPIDTATTILEYLSISVASQCSLTVWLRTSLQRSELTYGKR